MEFPLESNVLRLLCCKISGQLWRGGKGCGKKWGNFVPGKRVKNGIGKTSPASQTCQVMKAGNKTTGTRLRLVLEPDVAIGPGKADMLEGIGETGSISAAGRRMGMSYKRAWVIVDALNRAFDAPLVETAKGGARGGGARLTPLGEEVLARFRRIEALAEEAAKDEIAALRARLSGSG